MQLIHSNNLHELPVAISSKIMVKGLHQALMTELHYRGF